MKKHIVCFSGGKDSAAMLLRMIEMEMQVDLVLFADTGKEFPQLYAYVDRMEKYITSLGIEFRRVAPEKTWDDWFFGKVTRGKMEGQQRGWPLMFFHCYWSRESKFQPYIVSKVIKMIADSKDDTDILLEKVSFEAEAEIND